MKGLARYIFFAATILSLLLLLACSALCRHSKSRIDEAHYLSADGGLYSIRIHFPQAQLSWLADAPKRYEDYPLAMQPRRGWSAASYVPGSSETFKNDHLPGLTPADNNPADPDLDLGTTTVVHQWVSRVDLVHGFGWRETCREGSVAVEFQQLCFPAWAVLVLLSLLPSLFLMGLAFKTPPLRRLWMASLPRRGMLRSEMAASALSSALSPLHAMAATSAGAIAALALRWGYASLMVALLLVGIAATAVWARSHWTDDWISRSSDQSSTFATSFDSHHGRFALWRRCSRGFDPKPVHWKLDANGYQGEDPFIFWDWNAGIGGFNALTLISDGTRGRAIVLPDWAIVLLLTGPPFAWLAATSRRRIRRRKRDGLCPVCGFDLRASPLRCPECGLPRDAKFSPGIGAAHQLSFAAMALLLGGVIASAWWSNPLRGATAGHGANREAGILYDLSWQPPHGLDDKRMFYSDATWDLTWYQSIWHHAERPRDDRLVLLTNTGMSLFNDYWRVVVLDRSMHVIRAGQVPLPQQSTPYRLVEIRSDRADLRDEYRGKWILAVEWVCARKFREDPLKISPADIGRALVDWDNTAPVQFADWPDVAIRPAEPVDCKAEAK